MRIPTRGFTYGPAVRWCPTHELPIKRGTLRCMKCRTDQRLPRTRSHLIVDPSRLRATGPKAGRPTKRAIERRQKGYVS